MSKCPCEMKWYDFILELLAHIALGMVIAIVFIPLSIILLVCGVVEWVKDLVNFKS